MVINIYLREVYDDYKSYHDYIVNMKKDQEIQILSLLKILLIIQGRFFPFIQKIHLVEKILTY